MAEQLAEAPEVTAEHLLIRIEDWTERLSKLYSDVEEWVGQLGIYTTQRVRNVKMYEELMERFSLDAVMLDFLVKSPDMRVPRIDAYPYLWAIDRFAVCLPLLWSEGDVSQERSAKSLRNPSEDRTRKSLKIKTLA